MKRESQAAASAWILSSLIPVFAQQSLPANPVVMQGTVTIDQSNAAITTITQTTQKAVVNWDNFSIVSGNTVNFIQPDRNAIAVNRVTGSGLSLIDGALTANGQVWVLNPNGVLFGAGSQINTAGFLATTRALSDSDFSAGRYSFTDPLKQGGQIINRGTITSHAGAYAVLAGQQVRNEGIIEAKLGQVVLGGAQAFTLDLIGDKLLSFAVTTPVSLQPVDGRALVDNSGVLQADGGRVQMSARAAAEVVGSVINTSGLVQADSASFVNGTIVLDAGASGNLTNTGIISTSGDTGGSISISGKQIFQTGSIHADGADGDGGAITLLASDRLYGGGSISANAGNSGNGGSVILMSDLANRNSATIVSGNISAQGGTVGGNGGFIETSGSTLNIDGSTSINTKAPKGKTGTWLLDPGEINIVAGTGGSYTATGTDPNIIRTFNSSGSIGAEKLVEALGFSNVEIATDANLSGSGDININAPVSWATNNLKLTAHNNINVNAPLDAGNGSLTFQYGFASADGYGSAVNVAPNVEILIQDASAFHWQKGSSGNLNNLVLQNEYLRFGDGIVASINGSGAPIEPYYKDQYGASCSIVDGWCKASYSTTPLSFGIGLGTYSGASYGSWNTDTVIYQTQDAYTQQYPVIISPAGQVAQLATSGQTTSTATSVPAGYVFSLPSMVLNIAGYKMGTGSIEAKYTFAYNNSEVKVSNIYSLKSGDRFLATTTAVQAGASALSNIQFWTGISDDWLSSSDIVLKTKGNLNATGFDMATSTSAQANAVMATDPSNLAVALLYSSAVTADSILGETYGSFAQIITKDPKSSALQFSSDGAYGLYAKANDLAAYGQASVVSYFGLALQNDVAALTTQIADASGLTAAAAKAAAEAAAEAKAIADAKAAVAAATSAVVQIAPVPVAPAPAPATTSAPAPATSSAPAPATTSAPAPATTSAPAPATTSAPAPATTSAPAPATSSVPATSSPVNTGSPVAIATSVVAPPPPSPVGTVKPPTPTDAADSGDKTLSAAVPPPPPAAASQQRRSAAPPPNAVVGMVSIEPLAQASIPAAAAGEQRFSLGGNSSAW